MTNSVIKKHPSTGLMYITDGDEATIVGCTSLSVERLEIPPYIADGVAQYRVTGVGEAAFSYMSGLKTLSLPTTLTHIDQGAFEHTGLTEVTLHDGLVSLAPYAFFNCVNLSRVVLPSSGLTQLQEQVFGGCPALNRSSMTNLGSIPAGAIHATALPAAPAPVVPAVTDPSALPRYTPQELLDIGAALEEEGKYTDAAVYYAQAHAIRAITETDPDLAARVSNLNATIEAEYRLGVLLKLNLTPPRSLSGVALPSALELLKLTADSSNTADAMYHLGDLYAGGYGVEANAAEALRYLKRAAAVGHERACLDLAYVYLDGTLDHANTDTALSYFRKCAEFGGPYAFLAREELTYLEEAREIYQQMQRGDAGAAYTLHLLLERRPNALSFATAMDCLLKAADLGHISAIGKLHDLCLAAEDYAGAYKWKSLLDD
ncbi:MAG: leucine-rich repeat protein [Clostridia bacterium]|nr:leucine-rich repeat protein [Clostridia bacterium]